MQIWTKKFKSLLNLFLQSNCPLCGRATPMELCQGCHRQLHKCHIQNPCQLWHQPLPVFAWGFYGGALKRALAAIKYEYNPQLAHLLGVWLGSAWLVHSPPCDLRKVVVPIPLHPDKQKQRGYNQAALIARGFCTTTGLKLQQNGLQRVANTVAQFGLSVSERKKNLTKAFSIGSDFRRSPDSSVLLVDDIYTTGATVNSAKDTLSQSGIKVCGVVAIATPAKF